MATANPDRGEHELALDGVDYVLRPSHQAIRAIERVTERSLLDLTRLGNVGGLTVDECAAIAVELIRAGAGKDDQATSNVGVARVGELIFEAGLHKAMARLTLCLIDAASGGRTASGEAKPAPATAAA